MSNFEIISKPTFNFFKIVLITLLIFFSLDLIFGKFIYKKFITIDKKKKKEMKKKPMGHYLISYSCFNYYHPEIVKYIDSRL